MLHNICIEHFMPDPDIGDDLLDYGINAIGNENNVGGAMARMA